MSLTTPTTVNQSPRGAAQPDAPADRRLAGPVLPRERLVHEDDRRGVRRIRIRNVAAVHDTDAHGPEVARGDDLEAGARLLAGPRLRLAFDGHAGGEVVAANRQRGRGAGALDAGKRGDRAQRAVVERAPRLRRLRALAGERHVERQQVAGANAGVDARQRVEAPQQQAGTHEQHQGDGDLEGDERVAGPAGAAPLRSSTAGLTEIGVDAADRRVKRRRKAAQHAGARATGAR